MVIVRSTARSAPTSSVAGAGASLPAGGASAYPQVPHGRLAVGMPLDDVEQLRDAKEPARRLRTR